MGVTYTGTAFAMGTRAGTGTGVFEGEERAARRRSIRRLDAPIRLKLALLLGLVAVLAILIPAGVQAGTQIEQERRGALDDMLEVARNVALQVEGQIMQLEQELSLLARDPYFIEDVAAGDEARVTRRLEAVVLADPDLTALAVLDRNGQTWSVSLADKSTIGADLSQQIQIRDAVALGRPAVGQARQSLVGARPIVPIAVPIRGPDGRIVGILQAGLSLEHLSSALNGLRVGRTGYVNLLERRGTVLTSPNPNRILAEGIGGSGFGPETAGRPASAETTDDTGTRVFAAAVPIESIGWVARAQVPVAERLDPLWASLRRAALTAVVAMLVAVAVGVFFARRLAAPILALRDATRRVARGDYALTLPRVRSRDELEDLAEDFSAMTARLREAMAGLEARAEEQARLYAAAERERALATAILDAIDEVIVFVEADGRLSLANRRVQALFGVPPASLIGWHFAGRGAGFRRIFADPDRFAAVVDGTAGDAERIIADIVPTIWPAERELALFSAPVKEQDGRFLGRLYVFRDVTHEREVDRMKSELISLVSHELRTPLTSIKGYVDLLRDGAVGDLSADQDEFLGIVSANSDRLIALINDLLDISRIESGRVQLHLTQLDLPAAIRRVATTLRPQIEAKAQRLTLDVPDETPPVRADAARVEQILNNLLSNAHKYTPACGAIRVSVTTDGDGMLRAAVSDTGVGLTEDEQAGLFQKFYRAENRATQEVAGTGLGLAITRSLVEMHGGAITVDSTPGEGSTFAFTLPIAAIAEPAEPPASAPVTGAASGKQILVVEDDADIAGLIRRYLERAGYRVRIATTAGEAMRAVHAEPPDMITLDIVLPDVDGLALLDRLKHDPSTAGVPVLLVSVMPDAGHGRRLGAIGQLGKPVDERELLGHVETILAGGDRRNTAARKTILIADDDADTRRLLSDRLHRAGYATVTAPDGADAIVLARRRPPDLILLDVRMPVVDGPTALRALRSDPATAAVPVVMMTASPGAAESLNGRLGALGVSLLHKPLSAEELAAAIAVGLGTTTTT